MKIYISKHFVKQAKKLKKKFPHIKDDLVEALKFFKPDNEIHIGKSIFKLRIKSQDLNKGKSASLRCYVYLYRKKDLLTPICIYFKSENSIVSANELQFHFTSIIEELIDL